MGNISHNGRQIRWPWTCQKGYPKVEIIKQIRRMSESERILCAKTLYTLQFFTLVVSLRNYGV